MDFLKERLPKSSLDCFSRCCFKSFIVSQLKAKDFCKICRNCRDISGKSFSASFERGEEGGVSTAMIGVVRRKPFSFFPFLSLSSFYRTRVRSLGMFVSDSLTYSLTHSLLFSKLDWCDPGVWRCQLKTLWGCYCCWCWWWRSCWQQFVADLEAKLFFRLWAQGLVKILKLKFGWGCKVES